MRKLLQIFCFLFLSTQALAWWETPHMLVAQIAYEDMTPEARKRADELIAIHAKKYPKTNDFVSAAVWADDIRAQGNTAYSEWHYVTLTFEDLNEPQPTRESFPDAEHAASAINLEKVILQSEHASEEDKALALRRLIHWVGDVHQPLHATTHISPNYPKGDRGGNSFVVNLPKPLNNLHSLWDSGLDHWEDVDRPLTSSGKKYLHAESARLQQKHQEVNTNTHDPYAWALESHALARSYAYTGLEYKGTPTAAYIQQGQKISEERVVIAGQRLAQLLNATLRSSQ